MTLAEIQDVDEILDQWEKTIDRFAKNSADRIMAETNYESILATKMRQLREQGQPITFIKDIVKEDAEVMAAGNACGEAEMKVQAGKQKLVFLEALYNWRKAQQKGEVTVTGGNYATNAKIK